MRFERLARRPGRKVRKRPWIIAAVVAAVLWCALNWVADRGREPAEERIRRYFGITGAVDSASIRAAALRWVPIGSPESWLARFVAASGIGRAGDGV